MDRLANSNAFTESDQGSVLGVLVSKPHSSTLNISDDDSTTNGDTINVSDDDSTTNGDTVPAPYACSNHTRTVRWY